MDGLICKWGLILELLTALPTSCTADQSQSYSSAGGSSGGPVSVMGAAVGVYMWKGPKFEKRVHPLDEIVWRVNFEEGCWGFSEEQDLPI